jgi:hypothetical protein
MAAQKSSPAGKPAAKTAASKEDKTYYIVNPAGAIHPADYQHARWRLASPGWRSATAAEVEALKKAGGRQVHDSPICPPWSPEPVGLAEPAEAGEAEEVG